MKELELNEKMYYACSKCSTRSKVQWHQPGTKMWNEHKKYIDLEETNSDSPKYFWCTFHRRPHALNRECIKYRAIIKHNGESGSLGKRPSQISHNDVLTEIRHYVASNSKAIDWKRIIGRNSLPWPCTRETNLTRPDLIYCEPNKALRFHVSITNIIEFETKTPAEIIADKVQRFNLSSKKMIEGNAQSKTKLPRVIILYDKQTNISLNQVRKDVSNIKYEYLDNVFIDYYDESGDWFGKFFQQ
jgi:hypothetical protein